MRGYSGLAGQVSAQDAVPAGWQTDTLKCRYSHEPESWGHGAAPHHKAGPQAHFMSPGGQGKAGEPRGPSRHRQGRRAGAWTSVPHGTGPEHRSEEVPKASTEAGLGELTAALTTGDPAARRSCGFSRRASLGTDSESSLALWPLVGASQFSHL